MKILEYILKIVASIFGLWSDRSKKRRNKKKIQYDKEIADAIKKGNGRKVAEEWKRRKRYSS